MCQNGVRAKETKADIAEHVFFTFRRVSKANVRTSSIFTCIACIMKAINAFFESAFKDFSFHFFLKASD